MDYKMPVYKYLYPCGLILAPKSPRVVVSMSHGGINRCT